MYKFDVMSLSDFIKNWVYGIFNEVALGLGMLLLGSLCVTFPIYTVWYVFGIYFSLSGMLCLCVFIPSVLGPFETLSLSNTFSLSSLQGRLWHQGSEQLGHVWQMGDIVGCMLDLDQCTVMFTLNGELLLNDRGSELAAKEFDVQEGLWCPVSC